MSKWAAAGALIAALSLVGCGPAKTHQDGGAIPDSGVHGDAGSTDSGIPQTVSLIDTMKSGGAYIPTTPAFIAGKDGDGAWVPLTGSGGHYTLTVKDPAGRYSITVVCAPDPAAITTVISYQATVAELPEINLDICLDTSSPLEFDQTLTSSNWPAGAMQTSVSYGSNTTFSSAPGTTDKLKVQQGTYDIFATVGSVASFVYMPQRFILSHDVQVNGVGSRNLDFSPTTSAPLTSFVPSMGGVAATDLSVARSVEFVTSDGSDHSLQSTSDLSLSSPGIPLASQGPKDAHLILVIATGMGGNQRAVFRGLRAPAAITLTPPPYFISAKASAIAKTPYARGKFEWTGGNPTPRLLLAAFQQTQRSWYFFATSGSLPDTTYTQPDLSGVAGWDNAWAMQTGVSGSYTFYVLSGNRSVDTLLQFLLQRRNLTDGEEALLSARSDVITF